ncbi:hypothetical protein RND71_005961 [Anisodus tanguticus]|uniref:Transmembrane 9 superfamily member n=1 Tax=Anisodus tanguticus TaxID=243964 RepID=A0AAE1SR35_9SOLA|nr:hypothetical protein RND71_005961 [Anisodus tanguticus]
MQALAVPPHFHHLLFFLRIPDSCKGTILKLLEVEGTYQEDDSVTLWVNKAGPYFNPQETYSYYSLPYCRPADGDHKRGGLGEALGGNDIAESTLSLRVNHSQESPKPLEEGKVLDMTYSVKWVPTNISYAKRFNVYLNYNFFENEIHWFSVVSSIMMVIFLTGLVSMILMCTLRNDYAKYARENDDMETLVKLFLPINQVLA